MRFKINKPWYQCPVIVEGITDCYTNLVCDQVYEYRLVEDNPESQFMYATTKFEDETGKEYDGKVELMRDNIEILEKDIGEP